MYREGKEEPNAMPLGNAAHTYELMGEYKKATEVYVQLMETLDGHKTSYVTNSDISCNYARSGQLDKAFAILERNMQENRGYVKLLYRACLYAGDWKRAERMYEESVGDRRMKLDYAIRQFEEALRREERSEVDEARQQLCELMEEEN